MVRQSPDMALPAHLDMVSSHMSVLQDTPEHKERLAASLAKLGKTGKPGTTPWATPV